MDQSFHYLIMINQSLFQKKILSQLTEIGLSSGQPKILDFLKLHDGTMQKELAFGCQIEPATLTGILERMEEKELIERRYKEKNRRSSYVFLTQKGKIFAKKTTEIFENMEQEVFTGISAEEKQQFINTFLKICENMTSLEGLQ